MIGYIDILREILKASTFEEAQVNLRSALLAQLEGTHQQLVINDNDDEMRKQLEDLIAEFSIGEPIGGYQSITANQQLERINDNIRTLEEEHLRLSLQVHIPDMSELPTTVEEITLGIIESKIKKLRKMADDIINKEGQSVKASKN